MIFQIQGSIKGIKYIKRDQRSSNFNLIGSFNKRYVYVEHTGNYLANEY